MPIQQMFLGAGKAADIEDSFFINRFNWGSLSGNNAQQGYQLYGVSSDSDGNIYASGTKKEYQSNRNWPNSNGLIVKLNEAGAMQLERAVYSPQNGNYKSGAYCGGCVVVEFSHSGYNSGAKTPVLLVNLMNDRWSQMAGALFKASDLDMVQHFMGSEMSMTQNGHNCDGYLTNFGSGDQEPRFYMVSRKSQVYRIGFDHTLNAGTSYSSFIEFSRKATTATTNNNQNPLESCWGIACEKGAAGNPGAYLIGNPGLSGGSSNAYTPMHVRKVNSAFNVEWNKVANYPYWSSGNDSFRYNGQAGVCAYSSGCYVATSENTRQGYVKSHGRIWKWQGSDGELLWSRRIKPSGPNSRPQLFLYSCDADKDDNVYACGYVKLGGSGDSITNTAGFICKFNSSGTIQWQRQVKFPNRSQGIFDFRKIHITKKGTLIIVGSCVFDGNGSTGGWYQPQMQSGTTQEDYIQGVMLKIPPGDIVNSGGSTVNLLGNYSGWGTNNDVTYEATSFTIETESVSDSDRAYQNNNETDTSYRNGDNTDTSWSGGDDDISFGTGTLVT